MDTTQIRTAPRPPLTCSIETTLAESRYGTPYPTLLLDSDRRSVLTSAATRRFHAALLRIAADVELFSPAAAKWVVEVHHDGDACGRVVIELADGADWEACLAMDVLSQVAAQASRTLP